MQKVSDKNAHHDAELQKTIYDIQPESVVWFFNLLGTELEQAYPAHYEGYSYKGGCCFGLSHPYECDNADENDGSENTPDARTKPNI